jgi:hypothetical protein
MAVLASNLKGTRYERSDARIDIKSLVHSGRGCLERKIFETD